MAIISFIHCNCESSFDSSSSFRNIRLISRSFLGKSEDYDNFQEDFRRCAATSFLKYAADLSTAGLSPPGEKKKDFVDGKWLDFALEMTLEFYKDADTVSSYRFRREF